MNPKTLNSPKMPLNKKLLLQVRFINTSSWIADLAFWQSWDITFNGIHFDTTPCCTFPKKLPVIKQLSLLLLCFEIDMWTTSHREATRQKLNREIDIFCFWKVRRVQICYFRWVLPSIQQIFPWSNRFKAAILDGKLSHDYLDWFWNQDNRAFLFFLYPISKQFRKKWL